MKALVVRPERSGSFAFAFFDSESPAIRPRISQVQSRSDEYDRFLVPYGSHSIAAHPWHTALAYSSDCLMVIKMDTDRGSVSVARSPFGSE